MLLYKQIKTINKEFARKKLSKLLKEDIPNGDPTTLAVIKKNETGKYILSAREENLLLKTQN